MYLHSSPDDVEVKPNLRTCGRTAPPKQKLPKTLTKQSSVPTIPTRFEVTLFQGAREHLGFGSHALRFGGTSAIADEVPGPGNYKPLKTIHDEISDRTSWGIRGTGGFASKTVRFGARSLPSLPRPGRGCPGPGAYEPDPAHQKLRTHTDFNQARHTAVFADHVGKTAPSAPPAPGPGHYSAGSLAKEAAAAQSAFRSASLRTTGMPSAEDFPGPGEYFEDAQPLAEQGGARATNAVFKEPTQRRIVPVHRDLPAADTRARRILGSFADEVGRECTGTLGQPNRIGPGHYDQDRDAIWESHLIGAYGSSSFQPGSKRHEWAPEEVGRRPGPGNYEPRPVATHRVTSAVSAFSSATERNKTLFTSAPGPAYYSPQPPKLTKSFMLNAKRQWVQ